VAGRDGDDVVVVHLDVRREIARWRLPGARPQGACLLDDGRGLRWWLPHGDGIVEIDPRRWTIVARHPAPGPAVSLQAMGRAGMSDPRLWGLVESGPLRRLASRRDGAWRWVDEAPRDPIACAVDADRRRLLVAAHDPATVTSLDAAGRVSDTWPLPATDPVRGLAVLPRQPAAQPL
jgi:hypothetical protein